MPFDEAEARAEAWPMPVNRDNQFWVYGIATMRLLIQRCVDCRILRHPPGPMCPDCLSEAWDTIEAAGRGTVYSYTVHHRPPISGFDAPFVVLLVELEEGVRMIGNLLDVAPDAVRIGMPVELFFPAEGEKGARLPQWRLAGGRR